MLCGALSANLPQLPAVSAWHCLPNLSNSFPSPFSLPSAQPWPTCSISSPPTGLFSPSDSSGQPFRGVPTDTYFSFSPKASLSPASLLPYFLLEMPLSLYIPILICMTELPPAPLAHPSVPTYLHGHPPHLPGGVEGQRRERNWGNPLVLFHSIFCIHLQATDTFCHLPSHALCSISPQLSRGGSVTAAQQAFPYTPPLPTCWVPPTQGWK